VWARSIAAVLASLFVGNIVLWRPAGAESSPARPVAEVAAIGRIVNAAGSVTVEHTNPVILQAAFSPGDGVARVKLGDPVYHGDVVQTGVDGTLGITFTDGTVFNLSSNARMVLDEFVYDPNGKSNSNLFRLSKGTFTFIAGKIAKTGTMKVDTPVATMGIRGTAPRVQIFEDGSVAFSTLIEEKSVGTDRRGRGGNRRGQPGQQLQQKGASSPDAPASQQPADNHAKIREINLKICRGC
jgi:hypothetical protein